MSDKTPTQETTNLNSASGTAQTRSVPSSNEGTSPEAGNVNGAQMGSPAVPAGGAQFSQQGGYYYGSDLNGGNGGKPYNKHYNVNNNSNRQNYNNRHNYNNRKNYNQKINHHGGQYNNYSNYPANMYAYGYYPSPYGYPTAIVPGITPVPGYGAQQPFAPMPPGGKIKITDKEGKQIDLDEKKKTTSNTTPIGSPAASIASSVTPLASPANSLVSPHVPFAHAVSEEKPTVKVPLQSASSTATSSPVTTQASASNASKQAIADEFKRKILEKAAKRLQEAEAKKAKQEPKVESKVEASVVTKPVEKQEVKKETEVKLEPVDESKNKAELSKVPDAVIEMKPNTEIPSQDAIASQTQETSETNVHTVEPKSAIESSTPEKSAMNVPVDSEKEPVVVSEGKQDSSIDTKSATVLGAEKESIQDETEGSKEVNIEQDSEISKEELENPQEATSHTEQPTEDSKESGSETIEPFEGEQKEEESAFKLSQFFDRLKIAKEIEDPLTYEYPSPIVGPDASKQLESKKYRYDPQFLIQFKDVVQYPIDDEWKNKLEGLGIVSNFNKARAQSQSNRGMNRFNNMSGRFGSSMSGRGQYNERQNSRTGSKRKGASGSSRDKSTRKGQSRRGGRDRDGKEINDIPPEDIKPLEPSANRWVPRSRTKKAEVRLAPDGSEMLEAEEIERKVKSLLNKLTLEMFDTISDDLLKIADQSKWEDDAITVRRIISLTFAKACDEPYWSSMYAQFCAKMCTSLPDEVKDVNIVLKNGQPATGGDLARRILLTTCQAEYEKGWTDKLPTNPDGSPLEPEMMSDEYYIMAAAKRRGLGLVKFIGHLYILGMLNDQVILLCLRDQSKNTVDPSEDSLENLAQLVKTVGAKLETTDKNRTVLNLVFDNIQIVLDNCKLPSRIKFMLMDLQDLRASKWNSGKSEPGPKTIQEIHNEAELKKLEDEKANAEKRRKNRGNEQRSNSSRTGSSWGNNNSNSNHSNHSNHGNHGNHNNHNTNTNNQSKRSEPRVQTKGDSFTPVQSRSQSNRPPNTSTSEGQKDSFKRTESVQSNMFAALGEGGDDDDNNEEVNNEVPSVPSETIGATET